MLAHEPFGGALLQAKGPTLRTGKTVRYLRQHIHTHARTQTHNLLLFKAGDLVGSFQDRLVTHLLYKTFQLPSRK